MAFAVSGPTPALAAEKSSAMVIDANTGKVLHDRAGNELRHPASLTKMMTIYIIFETIEAGRTSLSTPVTVSDRAASAAPSKLGLKAGSEIPLRDVIKALIVKSANDMAVAAAEHIAGSESAFAALMTKRARLLGMSRTVFRNASGLPNDEQVTTAHDMLKLALRLQDDFPQYFKLFSTPNFTYGGKTYRSHNALLRRFPGVDGIKTGYTRDSGFNLVSSYRSNGKHIVAAVFGGVTASLRDAHMRMLLARAIDQASTTRTRPAGPQLVASAQPAQRERVKSHSPVPAPSPQISIAKVKSVSVLEPVQPSVAVAAPVQAVTAAPDPSAPTAPPVPAAATAPSANHGPGRPPSTLQAQLARFDTPSPNHLGAREAAPPVMAAGAAPAPAPVPAPRPAKGGKSYDVQIGVYTSVADAERAMSSARTKVAHVLEGRQPMAIPLMQGNRQLYRARFAGFDQTSATAACTEMRRHALDCFVARTN